MGDSGGGVLQHLGLEQYSQLFESEEIDLPILDKLREEQLSRIGVITMGQRMRLLSAAREAVIVTQVDEEGSEGEEGEEEVGGDAEEDGEGGEVGDRPHHRQTSPQKAKQTEA